jgi:hypothetical protein
MDQTVAMDQTVEIAPTAQLAAPAATPQVPSKPAAPPQRLEEVVKLVKMELVAGRAVKYERGSGFNPYDKGSIRDLWAVRRRA